MHPIIKAYTEQIKKLHDEIDVLHTKIGDIKECCNETKRVFNNSSGKDPYSQGRTIEAEHILQLIERNNNGNRCK